MATDNFGTVFLNGVLMDAREARVSIFDRGFLYGDGLFETIRIQDKRAFRCQGHFDRLNQGLRLLKIRLPCEVSELHRHANELIAANHCQDGVLRLTISRGPGARGLSTRGTGDTTVVMTLHPAPDRNQAGGLRLITAPHRILSSNPLAAVKSASKLGYVLARQAAEAGGADDALLLNQRGEVAETTSSNLFWTQGDAVFTAAIGVGVLPGVARGIVLSLAPKLGCHVQQVAADIGSLWEADGVFATNVVRGVVPVVEVDGRKTRCSEFTEKLCQAFEDLVKEDRE